jgi:hypothetical protein
MSYEQIRNSNVYTKIGKNKLERSRGRNDAKKMKELQKNLRIVAQPTTLFKFKYERNEQSYHFGRPTEYTAKSAATQRYLQNSYLGPYDLVVRVKLYT